MGINGLTSFLTQSYLEEVLEDLKLQNSLLLIDGYSLLYKFNYLNNIPSFYGGNYDELAARLDDLFRIFQKCQIEPIVLLDGGRDINDRKFQTSLKRAQQRLHDGCSLNAGLLENNKKTKNLTKISLDTLIQAGNYEVLNRLLPIMSPKVFIDCMIRNKIRFFQCNFEADYELASLANELKCPLMSCDSDFFIYNLIHGYLSIDYIDLNVKRLNEFVNQFGYIPCKLFSLSKLIECLKSNLEIAELKHEYLAIFAVLLGNDYADKSLFNSLMKTFDSTNNNLKLVKLKRNKSGYTKRKNNYFKKLLEWLSVYETTEECVEQILKFIKQENHDLVKSVIKESIKEYCLLKPSQSKHFLNNIKYEDENLLTFNMIKLNDEFVEMFRQARLSRFMLDILMHRKVIFQTQVELADWESTYLSSLPIRRVFYSLLINKYEKNQDTCVQEYLRCGKQIKIYEVKIDSILKSDQFIDLKFDYVNLFSFGEQLSQHLSEFKLNLKLKNLFITIYFWLNLVRNLTDIKMDNFKRAFFVCLIKCDLIDKTSSNKSNNELNLNQIEANDVEKLTSNFMQSLRIDLDASDYLRDLKLKLSSFTSKSFNLKLIHCLCEFQSVYLSLNCLQELMSALHGDSNPIQLIGLDLFFNAAFLHNFIENLERRSHPDLYIEELFGRKSYFKHLYYDLMNLFNKMFN